MKTIVPLYSALMVELERRRHATGISMDEMSDLMGTADRSYAKMLYPETKSGRVAQWDHVQKAVDVLFADGFELRLLRSKTAPLTSEGTRRKIKQSAAFYDRKSLSERMRELACLRASILTEEERISIARRAARRRWRKARAVQSEGAQP